MRRILAVLALVGAAATVRADEPKRYDFPDARCSAVFPKKPKSESRTILTVAGEQKLNVWVGSGGDDLSLSVTYTDYPPKYTEVDAKKLLEAVRDGMRTKEAALLSDPPAVAVTDDHTGRLPRLDFVYDHGKYLARTRLVLAGKRLYQVTVIGPRGGVLGKTAEEFLLSFEVKR